VLLAIDIGNTNVVIGLLDGRTLIHSWRLATHRQYTSDECAAVFRSLFDLSGADPSVVTHSIISCVVPPLLPIFERSCEKCFGSTPLVVGPGMRTGMPIRVDNPPEVGADRIVNAIAASDLFGNPVIAIDFGTALTFDCVSAQGEFVGGVILPGLLVSLDALISRASKLASVELHKPPTVIGRNTTHMLQSGMLYGYAGMVDQTVQRIRAELGADARVLATGGLAHLVASETESIERVEPNLTLNGLRILYERNSDTPADGRET
jgi:type III pantothenate kinase